MYRALFLLVIIGNLIGCDYASQRANLQRLRVENATLRAENEQLRAATTSYDEIKVNDEGLPILPSQSSPEHGFLRFPVEVEEAMLGEGNSGPVLPIEDVPEDLLNGSEVKNLNVEAFDEVPQ